MRENYLKMAAAFIKESGSVMQVEGVSAWLLASLERHRKHVGSRYNYWRSGNWNTWEVVALFYKSFYFLARSLFNTVLVLDWIGYAFQYPCNVSKRKPETCICFVYPNRFSVVITEGSGSWFYTGELLWALIKPSCLWAKFIMFARLICFSLIGHLIIQSLPYIMDSWMSTEKGSSVRAKW